MLNQNKFKNYELKPWVGPIKSFLTMNFLRHPAVRQGVLEENLPAHCPFARYYKCDFIDANVTVGPEIKH